MAGTRCEELLHEVKKLRSTKRFEKPHPETVWPTRVAAGELNWKLRYTQKDGRCVLTNDEANMLASICSAYDHLRSVPKALWAQRIEHEIILRKERGEEDVVLGLQLALKVLSDE